MENTEEFKNQSVIKERNLQMDMTLAIIGIMTQREKNNAIVDKFITAEEFIPTINVWFKRRTTKEEVEEILHSCYNFHIVEIRNIIGVKAYKLSIQEPQIQLKYNLAMDIAFAMVYIMLCRETSSEPDKFMKSEDFLFTLNSYFGHILKIDKELVEKIFRSSYFRLCIAEKSVDKINHYRLSILGGSKIFGR